MRRSRSQFTNIAGVGLDTLVSAGFFYFIMCWCCRFARVLGLQIKQVARSLHLRFTAFTGDAMGMNMVSKVTVVESVYFYVSVLI